MTRGASITVENNFNRGLLTEFTAANFPENAVTDADNVIFGELGRVTRRPGIDFEENAVARAFTGLETDAIVEYRWSSVGQNGTRTFIVQQVGSKVHFFSSVEGESLSGNLESFLVDMTDYKTSGTLDSEVAKEKCSFSDGRGYLFVTNPNCNPIYIEYDEENNDIIVTEITIEIRDFEGVDDGLDIETRPTTLSALHKYNLYNQGWYATAQGSDTTNQNIVQTLDYFYNRLGYYPNHADAWWYYTRVQPSGDTAGVAALYPAMVEMTEGYFGNTPVPKGHYIYNAFDIDRSAVSGIDGLERVTSKGKRPSVCAFYAGRVFYAGTPHNRYSGKLYFTQTITSDTAIGRCYQNNDPTAKEVSDLLDTDGGVIDLPRIEKVVSMKVVGDTLIIFGTNGIYTIRGDNEGPFRATSYTVSFISTIGAVSDLSIVDLDGFLFWWNYDGIYSLTRGQLGDFEVQNVSKQTIQSVLDEVPPANKDYTKGIYNKKEQIVRWIYSDLEDLTGYRYNRILELNVASKAFYTHTIDVSVRANPIVSGIMTIAGQSSLVTDDDVTVQGVVVTVDGVDVTIETVVSVPRQEIFKFSCVWTFGSPSTTALSYVEMGNLNLRDWESFDSVGKDYSSYGVAGYRIRGDFLRNFNTTPVMFVCDNMTDGSLVVKSIWDYGMRTSIPQEIYRTLPHPDGDYVIRRIKFRGKGRSMQVRFESTSNKPFSLVGWSTYDTGGTLP